MKRTSLIAALCGVLFGPTLVRAHYLWIESDTRREARIYFGEIAEGVREKAGGRLDERDGIEVRALEAHKKAAEALSAKKNADHFAVVPSASKGWLMAQDLAGEVKDWTASDIGIVKPVFYTRAAIGGVITAAQPELVLDVIPDPADPNTLRIFFKQQPLPKAKVLVYAPNTWMQELQADEAGTVKIATPWKGRYVVDVIYKERTPGEFKGVAYQAIRHRATFTHQY